MRIFGSSAMNKLPLLMYEKVHHSGNAYYIAYAVFSGLTFVAN